MTIIDNRTVGFDLPLPSPQNELQVDVVRLREAFTIIDQVLSLKANADDVTMLVTDLQQAIAMISQVLPTLASIASVNAVDAKVTLNTAAIAELRTFLQALEGEIDAVDFKADANAAAIMALDAELDTKASITLLDQRIADLVGGAPAAYDTLREIADALQNQAVAGEVLTMLAQNKRATRLATAMALL